MCLECLGLGELLLTHFTFEEFLCAVDEHVSLHVCLLVEGAYTDGADPRLEPRVGEEVSLKVVLLENTRVVIVSQGVSAKEALSATERVKTTSNEKGVRRYLVKIKYYLGKEGK